MSRAEYAFEGFVYGMKSYWADAYPRLGDARRAAKQWIDRVPSRTATLLVRDTELEKWTPPMLGAQWKEVGKVKWTT